VAALGCAALITACRKPGGSPEIGVEQQIAPWPPRVGTATVTLRISGPGDSTIGGAHVTLEGDMSHPGMRPEFGLANEIAPGRYQGRLVFSMAGDWVILIHITLPDGRSVERQMDVKGVRAN